MEPIQDPLSKEEIDIHLDPSCDPITISATVRDMPSLRSIDLTCLNARVNQLQWNSGNVRTLFETIGSLPKLRKIQFKFLGGGDHDNMVPLSLFTALLNQSACQLESFRMVLVGPIICSTHDVMEFAQALRRQLHLKDFRLSSCYLAHETLLASCSIDPILRAIAALPSLESVSLKASSKGHLGNLIPDTIGSLCQSTSMKDLSLDNFVLNNHHMKSFSQALQTNRRLEVTYLNLSGELNIDPKMLPAALQENPGLKKLQLRLSNQKNVDEFLLNLASALKHNTSLKEMGVFGSLKISDDVEPAFSDMIESNCVLETLVLPSNFKDGWQEKIDMLLHLNRRGRQRLLRQSDSVSQEEWIEMFANASNDINFVYYYVRVGPLLSKLVSG